VIQISGIFNKNVIDSNLEKVNDIKMVQTAMGRMFGYGDVEILTASELGVNLFKRIDEPIRFKTAMLNAKEQMEKDITTEPAASTAANIPEMIARLDDLRKQGILSDEEFQQKKSELLTKL
jgi:ribosomal protein S20